LILFFAPLLGATLVAGYLLKDHHHNVADVIAGGIIGTATAWASFRTMYLGVWDYRVNHIPSPPAGIPMQEDLRLVPNEQG
jgi:membrane-associated phospholipid phosphatase